MPEDDDDDLDMDVDLDALDVDLNLDVNLDDLDVDLDVDLDDDDKPAGPAKTVEEDSREELTELQRQFREKAKASDAAFTDIADSEFYLCVVFQSRAQKEEFLAAVRLKADVHGDKYINAFDLAERIGVTLTTPVAKPLKAKTDKRLKSLAMEP